MKRSFTIMNILKINIAFSALLLVATASCSPDSKKPTDAANKHAQWVNSLSDTLTAVRQEMSDNIMLIASLDSSINRLSSYFTKTSNPKLVENYIITNDFVNYDTESNTGLIARITESNEFELIATLRGSSFNQIMVSDAQSAVKSSVVNYDKALNYKIGSTNIVAFKDAKSDSIGRLISDNEDANLKLKFINNSTSQSVSLSAKQKAMISRTWQYYNAIREKERLERQSLLLTEKAKILETRINQ